MHAIARLSRHVVLVREFAPKPCRLLRVLSTHKYVSELRGLHSRTEQYSSIVCQTMLRIAYITPSHGVRVQCFLGRHSQHVQRHVNSKPAGRITVLTRVLHEIR